MLGNGIPANIDTLLPLCFHSHSVPKGPLETTVLEQCPQGVLERQSLSGACFQNPTDRRSAQEIAQLRSRLSDPSTAAKCRTGYHTNSDTPIMGNSIRRPGTAMACLVSRHGRAHMHLQVDAIACPFHSPRKGRKIMHACTLILPSLSALECTL